MSCLGVWDQDVRGIYDDVIRLFYNGNHILLTSDQSKYAKMYMSNDTWIFETNFTGFRQPTDKELNITRYLEENEDDV